MVSRQPGCVDSQKRHGQPGGWGRMLRLGGIRVTIRVIFRSARGSARFIGGVAIVGLKWSTFRVPAATCSQISQSGWVASPTTL